MQLLRSAKKDMNMRMKNWIYLGLITMNIMLTSAVWADSAEYKIIIKDHQFLPAAFTIPANQKVKLVIENQDPTPEEFESYELNREKVISGNGKGIVFIGPLKPGQYKYFGDFHQDTAQGTIVVKE